MGEGWDGGKTPRTNELEFANMPRTYLLLIALLLLAVSGAALSAPHPSYAQDEEKYMDLWTEANLNTGTANANLFIDIHLGNEGNRTAYDVVVKIELKRSATRFRWVSLDLPDGTCLSQGKDSACLEVKNSGNIPLSSENSLFWKIPLLAAEEELELTLYFATASSTGVARYDIDVTSASHEREARRHDNSVQVWAVWKSTGGSLNEPNPNYAVEVRVDGRRPLAGGTVNFRVFAKNFNTSVNRSGRIEDGCVNIRLTGGLTAGTATFAKQAGTLFSNDPTSVTDGSLSFKTDATDDGIPEECGDKSGAAGFFLLSDGKDHLQIMTLPVTVTSGVTVSEQCLTAEIFATPTTGSAHGFDYPADNRVEYCLGYPPNHVFDEGEVSIWAVHACKYGTKNGGCDTAAEVQVEVFAITIEPDDGHGHGGGEDHTFTNATALIHVKDAPGRVFDDPTSLNNKSITNATTVSWQTATAVDPDFTGTKSGVFAGLYRAPINDYISNWTNYHPTIKLSGSPPGKMGVRSTSSGRRLWNVLSSTNPTAKRTNPFGLSSTSIVVTKLLFEFDQLGTYVVDFDVDMLHDSIDDNNDNTKDTFSGTGRTIFHVGPIAELGVGDYGAASPFATTEQVAFTVLGINNRDEYAESGKIEVELPAGTTGLTTVPADTGVFDASASPPTWTWDISDLALAGSLNSPGTPDGVPVTLIVEGVSAGAKAKAKVVYDPYEVCIGKTTATPPVPKTETAKTKADCDLITGASWHTGTVFDYDDTNNAATLTARNGAVGPSLASSKQSAVVVRWQQVKLVNGQWVKEYEVQRANSDSPASWSAAGTVPEVSYFTDAYADDTARYYRDAAVDPAKVYLYRVRAVNGAGVKGAWSRAAASPAPPGPAPAPAPRPEPANRSPQFSEGASASRSILENSEAGTDVGSPVLAEDANGDKLTYALEGDDAAAFSIEAGTGQILTKADLDYETKSRYKLRVTVSDGKNSRGEPREGADDYIEVSIAVTNQGEKGSVAFSETLPVVGTAIKATLTDPDGGVTGVSWVWERSSDGAQWTAIAGASSSAYTPVDGDSGHYLRATASYDDAHGPDKSASAALGGAVSAQTIAERYDANGDGAIGRSEALQAAADYRAGAISYAEALAVARLYFGQ